MGFNFNSIKCLELPQKHVTLEDIRNFLIDEERTKRIHFASTHATALKRKDEPNKVGILKLPFSDSIKPIIEKTLGDEVKLFSSQYDDGVFDDLYMSGATLQYVAMKLKEAGASRVLGITIVKSKSNK